MKLLTIALLAVASCRAASIPESAVVPASAPDIPAKPATARLVSDVRAIQPGSVFRVGVLIEMQPGWHVYWKNPGDAGLPTSIRLTAPPGFEIGPVVWPTPKRFTQPGDIVGYGYEDRALFVADVRAAKKIAPGSVVPIAAEVSWLCCEKVCVPGRATLGLDLAVGARSLSGDAALFDAWKPRAPVEPNDAGDIASVRIVVPPGTGADRALQMAIDVSWKRPVVAVEWFPVPGETLDVTSVSLESRTSQTRITFAVRPLDGLGAPPAQFESLVAFTDSHGERRSVRVPVALQRGDGG